MFRHRRIYTRAANRRDRRARIALGFCTQVLALVAASSPSAAQDSTGSRVGIAHIGAIGVNVGAASVEKATNGKEAGLFIDFGWFRTPRLRVQGEVGFLQATVSEFLVVRDSTFRGQIYDLTVSTAAVLNLREPGERLVPYVSGGVGVHALSGSFGGAVELERRYNANPFGAHAAGGVKMTLGRRNAVAIEARKTIAQNVDRTSFRLIGMVFFGDLIRSR